MAPGTHHALILLFDQQMTLSNLVYGGVLERHPGLKVAVLECGGGWIAHWMDRLDEFLESYGWATPPLSLDAERVLPAAVLDQLRSRASAPRRCSGRSSAPTASSGRRDFPHSDAKYPGVVDELREARTRPGRRRARRALRPQRARPVRHADPTLMASSISSSAAAPSSTAPAAPARTADVAVHDGRIAEIGARRRATAASEVVDADGLIVTPGFVDIHTHYDAQLHWDPTASPASWHGVTTICSPATAGSRCAPPKPDDLSWLLLMLSRVEGMSARRARRPRSTFGRRLVRRLPRQARRPRRRQRRRQRRPLRGAALRDGRRRVRAHRHRRRDRRDAGARARRVRATARSGSRRHSSSCTSPTTGAACRRNHAAPEELRRAGRGRSASSASARSSSSPARSSTGYDDDDRELIRRHGRGVGRGPCTSTRSRRCPTRPTAGSAASSSRSAAHADGLAIHPMFAANRQGAHFALAIDVPVRRDAELPRQA